MELVNKSHIEIDEAWPKPRKANFEKVQEFHSVMGLPRNVWPPTEELKSLRLRLLSEEFGELENEFYPIDTIPTDRGNLEIEVVPNRGQVAKEIADVLYVTYGMADAFGIDIDKVFSEVHKSNMSKLVDGKPLRREDGKVLKGPSYKPPDLSFVLGKGDD
jgi:predicted HAD superfamily Cof-like phosphohydrolase